MAPNKYMLCTLRLVEARNNFGGTKYNSIIVEAEKLWRTHTKLAETNAVLDKLPTEKQLLTELVAKLKGKSVHKALERAEGKSDWAALKAITSLLTHTAIACQQGETQYKKLIPNMLERINELSYKLIK